MAAGARVTAENFYGGRSVAPRTMAAVAQSPRLSCAPQTARRGRLSKGYTTDRANTNLNHCKWRCSPRSRSLVELRDFSSIGVQNGQKCPFQYSNVAVIKLTTPCSVSGHHPSRTLFADLRLPWVSPPLLMGWETALCAGKYSVFI
jgi:hypothetical protein